MRTAFIARNHGKFLMVVSGASMILRQRKHESTRCYVVAAKSESKHLEDRSTGVSLEGVEGRSTSLTVVLAGLLLMRYSCTSERGLPSGQNCTWRRGHGTLRDRTSVHQREVCDAQKGGPFCNLTQHHQSTVCLPGRTLRGGEGMAL